MNKKLIFVVEENYIKYFSNRLEDCKTSYDLYELESEISSFNDALYNSAVRKVAQSPSPIALLVDVVEVEQIKKISNVHREITLRTRNSIVSWSSVIQFIRANNKNQENQQIPSPFTNFDYMLLNIYGANLVKTPLPYSYDRFLRNLTRNLDGFDCFFFNSNSKLKIQLNILFDMISSKRNVPAGTVKAIERHSKFIYMEFIKYSSRIDNLSVVDVDRLIDLIIRQYINQINFSRTSTVSTSATSKMDIHKNHISTLKLKP